jgi:hypothetical protein
MAASAAQAAGSLVQGFAANRQAKYEASGARQNAQLEREAAQQSEKTGYQERRKLWREVGSVKGQQIASMAANGIDVDFGTAGRIQEDTQLLANEDAQNLYENINQRTRGYLINSSNNKTQSKALKAQGKSALIGSMFQAGGSLLSGFQQFSALRPKVEQPRFGTSSAT